MPISRPQPRLATALGQSATRKTPYLIAFIGILPQYDEPLSPEEARTRRSFRAAAMDTWRAVVAVA
jgi:hypothetical protein